MSDMLELVTDLAQLARALVDVACLARALVDLAAALRRQKGRGRGRIDRGCA